MDLEIVIYRSLFTTILVLGLSSNILLLLAVYRRRNSTNLRTFSVFVVEIAIFNIIGVSACWINMPSINTFNFYGVTSYKLYGIGLYFGQTSGYILHAVYGHIAGLVPVVVIVSFAVKYYSIIRYQPSVQTSTFFALVAYIPAIIYLMIYPTVLAPEPPNPPEGTIIWFNRSPLRFKIIKYSFVGIWLTTTLSSFLFRWLILRALSKFSSNMSDRTAKMHRMVVKALTLQALTPVIMLTVVAALLLEPIQEGSVLRGSLRFLLNHLIATLHACVPLFSIASYRQAIFGKKVGGKHTASESTQFKLPHIRVTNVS